MGKKIKFAGSQDLHVGGINFLLVWAPSVLLRYWGFQYGGRYGVRHAQSFWSEFICRRMCFAPRVHAEYVVPCLPCCHFLVPVCRKQRKERSRSSIDLGFRNFFRAARSAFSPSPAAAFANRPLSVCQSQTVTPTRRLLGPFPHCKYRHGPPQPPP